MASPESLNQDRLPELERYEPVLDNLARAGIRAEFVNDSDPNKPFGLRIDLLSSPLSQETYPENVLRKIMAMGDITNPEMMAALSPLSIEGWRVTSESYERRAEEEHRNRVRGRRVSGGEGIEPPPLERLTYNECDTQIHTDTGYSAEIRSNIVPMSTEVRRNGIIFFRSGDVVIERLTFLSSNHEQAFRKADEELFSKILKGTSVDKLPGLRAFVEKGGRSGIGFLAWFISLRTIHPNEYSIVANLAIGVLDRAYFGHDEIHPDIPRGWEATSTKLKHGLINKHGIEIPYAPERGQIISWFDKAISSYSIAHANSGKVRFEEDEPDGIVFMENHPQESIFFSLHV